MTITDDLDLEISESSDDRIIRLEIKGLLGRFDHKIEIPSEWNFVILHGPNGVGKTTILEIVNACFNRQFGRLANAPFGECSFFFKSGKFLNVRSHSATSIFDRGDGGELAVATRWVEFRLREIDGEIYEWSTTPVVSRPSRETVEYLARLVGATLAPSGRWRDPSGQLLDDDELFEEHSDQLPVRIPPAGVMPPPMNNFFRSTEVHLIETQRLLASRKLLKRGPGVVRRQRVSGSRAMDYSEDLTRRIRSALARNSTISQRRDRTFPRRVLSLGVHSDLPSEQQIRARYEAQRETRNQLAEISVLDMSEDVPLPDRNLDDWERIVLATYLDDAEEKLATFEPLLSRFAYCGILLTLASSTRH
ncbi:AAA family ATPase [Actinoplanes sp. NPDC048988]|uniref:AAA family ATPase n=1 Tax=Actinoplanes sp. NPDC048988 TaxID=3363901 RepID=UPI0037217472